MGGKGITRLWYPRKDGLYGRCLLWKSSLRNSAFLCDSAVNYAKKN